MEASVAAGPAGDPTSTSPLVAVWSAKGGVGTSVVAAALALLGAQRSPTGAALLDLAGDIPDILGIPGPTSPGLAGGLRAGPVSALAEQVRLSQADAFPTVADLVLVPRGDGPLDPPRVGDLCVALRTGPRPTVVDCGNALDGAATAAITVATTSYLVVRPCFLALKRARAPRCPAASGVIVVREPGRSLTTSAIEAAAGAPVVAEVPFDPAIALAVDAGVLPDRMPRALTRALGPLIPLTDPAARPEGRPT